VNKPLPDWPPLLGVEHQPRWLLVRDVLLTLLAWGVLLWMLAKPLALAWDFLLVKPYFELSRHAPIDWRGKWAVLQPFALVSALLVLWMLAWAFLRTRPLAAQVPQPAPAPLDAAEHAAHFGLDGPAVVQWREQKVGLAQFDQDNRLQAVTIRRPA
jgi:poly-beta-1,6-N-acetyl-D-glucosamine biosynthesis protein PgaD